MFRIHKDLKKTETAMSSSTVAAKSFNMHVLDFLQRGIDNIISLFPLSLQTAIK